MKNRPQLSTASFNHGIVNLARPLLCFIAHLDHLLKPPSIECLHSMLCLEFKLFCQALHRSGYDTLSCKSVSYCLAAAVDEAIMLSGHLNYQDWALRTLLSVFHNETWGGERFFIILNYYHRQSDNIEVLELLFLILSLGYQGKYHIADKLSLENLRTTLYKDHIEPERIRLMNQEHIVKTQLLNQTKTMIRKSIAATALITALIIGNYQVQLKNKVSNLQRLLNHDYQMQNLGHNNSW